VTLLACSYLRDPRLDDRKLGIPWRDHTPSRPAAYLQATAGLIDISVFSKSRHGLTLSRNNEGGFDASRGVGGVQPEEFIATQPLSMR
jgi:hypothetical protein